MPGIVVRIESGIDKETSITLDNVNSTSAGLYKCEVVSEMEQIFLTHRQYYNLSTIGNIPSKVIPILSDKTNRLFGSPKCLKGNHHKYGVTRKDTK